MRRKVDAYVARLHDSLHHIPSERLARMLRRSGAHPHVVQAAREYRCDACKAVERLDPRPKAADVCNVPGEVVGCDGFVWHTRALDKSACVSCSWTKDQNTLCQSLSKKPRLKLSWEMLFLTLCGNISWSLGCLALDSPRWFE